MMSLYFVNKSLLSERNSTRCVLALAIGSKLDGLVIEPNVPLRGTNSKSSTIKEKAAAIFG